MSSDKEYLNYIIEQLQKLENISYRAMMGEYLIYYNGKVIGGIYDNRFLVKKTKSSLELVPNAILEPPYNGAKEMILIEDVDDKDFLKNLIEAMYDELPFPKPRKKKSK